MPLIIQAAAVDYNKIKDVVKQAVLEPPALEAHYASGLTYMLPKAFIYTKNMKRVPPFTGKNLPPGAFINTDAWAISIFNIPAGAEASVWWDLPEPALDIYVHFAIETVANGVIGELRLMDTTTGNYFFLRKDTAASAGDHKVGKVINGVETVIATEPVDLTPDTQSEFSIWVTWDPFVQIWYYHSMRGRDKYGTIDLNQLAVPVVKLFGTMDSGNANVGKIDRVMFYAKNNTTTQQIVGIGSHLDSNKPFAILYDTVGSISL